MIIGIQGSRNFDDYRIFLDGMERPLSLLKDNDNILEIYSSGPAKLNSMAIAFANITERSMKARGMRIRIKKVPPSWMKTNYEKLSHFAFFTRPKEQVSELVDYLDAREVEVWVHRYPNVK